MKLLFLLGFLYLSIASHAQGIGPYSQTVKPAQYVQPISTDILLLGAKERQRQMEQNVRPYRTESAVVMNSPPNKSSHFISRHGHSLYFVKRHRGYYSLDNL
jgi:hypothetical protein